MLRGRRVADLQSCWGGCSAHSSVPPHHTLFVFASPWGWDSDIIHHSVHKNSFVAARDKPKRLIRQPEFAESAVLSWSWLVWKRWVWTSPGDSERRGDTFVRRCLLSWVTSMASTMLENVVVFHPPANGSRSVVFSRLCTDVWPRPCPQPSGWRLQLLRWGFKGLIFTCCSTGSVIWSQISQCMFCNANQIFNVIPLMRLHLAFVCWDILSDCVIWSRLQGSCCQPVATKRRTTRARPFLLALPNFYQTFLLLFNIRCAQLQFIPNAQISDTGPTSAGQLQ